MIDRKVQESIKDKAEDKGDAKKIEPLAAVEINDIKKNKEKYTAKGVEAIKNGKVAAVLLAGGQGTRLGLDKPKGTLNVGIYSFLDSSYIILWMLLTRQEHGFLFIS